MKQVQLRIQSNVEIADNVFCMVMEGDVGAITAPGQFINIRIGGKFLRRPISVCDVDTVATGTKRIEKEAGSGTAMTHIRPREEEESVQELSRILGGVRVTDAVRESAAEMRKMALEFKERL